MGTITIVPGYSSLLRLADEGSLERGRAYAADGRVRIESVGPDGVAAVAAGTHEYDVGVGPDDATCTCPVGLRGEFCKHLVAVVLTLEGGIERTARDPVHSDRLLRPDTEAWLADLDAEALRTVIEELASAPRVAETIDSLAAAATGDLSMLATAVDSLRVRGHLDYRRANRHGEDAHAVVDQLEQMLTPATADEMVPLVEKAIDHLVRALLRSDDSSGIQGGAVGRLLELHERAARIGDPDPVRLVRWMTRVGFAEHGFLDVDPVPYADALGERGMAAYRREVGKRLDDDPEDVSARLARERLAVLDRDIPAIVHLVGGPLDRPYHVQRLVEALLEVGAEDEALEHAVRGVEVAPTSHQTIPLYDTAVRLLRARGQDQEVLRLRRQQLATFPTEASYGSLRRAAREVGDWPNERLSALDVLLERNPDAWLRILVGEGEIDLAWDASRDMALGPTLAHLLLRARANERPADVFEGYVELVDQTLGPADRQAYSRAIGYLGELRRASGAGGRAREYDDYVADLVERHRRRPTLVAMLRRLPSAPAGGEG